MNYLRIQYESNDLLFLLVTGATISVMFSKILAIDELIGTHKQVLINGIATSTK